MVNNLLIIFTNGFDFLSDIFYLSRDCFRNLITVSTWFFLVLFDDMYASRILKISDHFL